MESVDIPQRTREQCAVPEHVVKIAEFRVNPPQSFHLDKPGRRILRIERGIESAIRVREVTGNTSDHAAHIRGFQKPFVEREVTDLWIIWFRGIPAFTQ